jgi:Holliday junction resolvasome RuvABC endonuclease subunit
MENKPKLNHLSSSAIGTGEGDLEQRAARYFTKVDPTVTESEENYHWTERIKHSKRFADQFRVGTALGVITVSYIVLRSGFEVSPMTSAAISGAVGTAYFVGMDQDTVLSRLFF